MIEGWAEWVEDPGEESVAAGAEESERKYGFKGPGPPYWELRPRIVFAWTDFTTDATRWRFDL